MFEVVLFVMGVAIGGIVTQILSHLKTGKGYFIIKKVPDEENIYTINVRLANNQKLTNKTRIILEREYADMNS